MANENGNPMSEANYTHLKDIMAVISEIKEVLGSVKSRADESQHQIESLAFKVDNQYAQLSDKISEQYERLTEKINSHSATTRDTLANFGQRIGAMESNQRIIDHQHLTQCPKHSADIQSLQAEINATKSKLVFSSGFIKGAYFIIVILTGIIGYLITYTAR